MKRTFRRRVAVALIMGMCAGSLQGLWEGQGQIVRAEAASDSSMAEGTDSGQTEPAELDENRKDAQGIVYTLDESAGTAMVGEVLDEVDENTSQYDGDGAVVIPEKVEKDGTVYTVTEVAFGAFFENRVVTSVTLPDTVVTLGQKSFYHSSVNRLTIGSGLETVSALALGSMDQLSDIEVSSENRNFIVKDGVLYDQSGTTLYLYPAGDSRSKFEIPEGVYRIHEAAFSFSRLTSVTFPETVRIIEEEAFYESAVETADLTFVMEIGDSAFWKCTSLRWARLGDYVVLGTDVFRDDSAMKVAVIPKGAKGMEAFRYVQNVSCVVIGEYAKATTPGNRNFFEKCPSLDTVVIGEGVTQLPYYCFYQCKGLGKVYLPSSMGSSNRWFYESSAAVYGWPESMYMWDCGNSYTCLSDHEHTLENRVFYEDEEICIKGKYCAECGHGEEISFLLSSEEVQPEAEALVYSLDENNQDEQEIQYTLYSNSRTAEVGVNSSSGSKNTSGYEGENDGNAVIPEYVEKDGVVYRVTEFDDKAFTTNQWLETLTLPDSLESVSGYSLAYCENLESMSCGEGNPYLMSVDGVLYTRDGKTLVKYPEQRKEKSYSIPEPVQTVSSYAFQKVTPLYEITFPKTLETIGYRSFEGAEHIKWLDLSCVKSIGFYAFDGATNVKAVILGADTSVGGFAFCDLDNLTAVYIPENVQLGEDTFYGCDTLNTVLMERGASFQEYTFLNCQKMRNLVFPEDLKTIPKNTFNGVGVSRFYLPASVETITVDEYISSTTVYGTPSDCTAKLTNFVNIATHTHDLQHTVFLENDFVKIEADFCTKCGYGENCVQTAYVGNAVTPTVEPTAEPTIKPTVEPTAAPTMEPTIKPTATPTTEPTIKPTAAPTVKPTEEPTIKPTVAPTAKPTAEPTTKPNSEPTVVSTEVPEADLDDDAEVNEAQDDEDGSEEWESGIRVRRFTLSSSDHKTVIIHWNKNKGVSCYRIYRAAKKNGKYKSIAMVSGNKTSYVDKKVKGTKLYYYKMAAGVKRDGVLLWGETSRSKKISVSELDAPQISVTKGKQGTIRYVTIALQKYEGEYADIYVATGGKNFKKLKLVTGKISRYNGKFKIRYVIKNTAIRFKVRTYSIKGKKKWYSQYSNVVKKKV